MVLRMWKCMILRYHPKWRIFFALFPFYLQLPISLKRQVWTIQSCQCTKCHCQRGKKAQILLIQGVGPKYAIYTQNWFVVYVDTKCVPFLLVITFWLSTFYFGHWVLFLFAILTVPYLRVMLLLNKSELWHSVTSAYLYLKTVYHWQQSLRHELVVGFWYFLQLVKIDIFVMIYANTL